MDKSNIKPKFKNVQLISADNQFYKLYLSQFKPDNSVVRNKSVAAKSQTMSYVLEIVIREWIKSSGLSIDDRIIHFQIEYDKRDKVTFKEVDYILKKGNQYVVGELKVKASPKGLLSEASKQLSFSKELLMSKSNSIEMQIIWVDLNYKNTNEPLDLFTPVFSKSQFRTIEIEGQKFKFLHLSAEDVFKWGVENKIIQTPELFPVAMKEIELLYQRRQQKDELKRTRKLLEDPNNEIGAENLNQTIVKIDKTLHLLEAQINLAQQGWVHLTNKTEDFLQELIDCLGKIIFATDVIVKSDSKSLLTSEKSLDFHTDHHKAKFIAWYCIKQTDKGGETILMDAEKVYHRLSENDRKELEQIDLHEHKVFPDDSASHPLVNNKGQRKFYYSFWLVREEQKKNPALLEFQRYIKISEPIKLLLQTNDILIVDNHRILHGRTSIDGSKDRFLKRFWLTAN